MAFRMKHWMALTGFCLALVAAWRLPPEAFLFGPDEVQPAEALRRDALEEEFRITADVLRRVLWADSLSELALREARDGLAVTMPELVDADPAAAAASADQRVRLTSLAASEIASLPARDPDMTFGYVLQPHDQSLAPDLPGSARERVETYVGTSDGRAYCLQVRVTRPDRIRSIVARKLGGGDYMTVSPRIGLLGPCRFFVAYGMPGSGIDRWLESGGAAFALESYAASEEVPSYQPRGDSRRTYLGFGTLGLPGQPIEADRCYSGQADACRALFEQPTAANPLLARQIPVTEASPALFIGTGGAYRSIGYDEEYLLADLEAEFGPQAFGRFWTSDAPVADAFASAFGTDVGAWVVGWIDRGVGIDPPGPGLPQSASSGAMLALAVLLGFAYLRNKRREVT